MDALSSSPHATKRCNRLGEGSGLGVDSAQQIIAEVGTRLRFPSGNRQMRRVLNQAANAAVKAKGTIFGERCKFVMFPVETITIFCKLEEGVLT